MAEKEILLKIRQIAHEGVDMKLPRQATRGSAGIDLSAAISKPTPVLPRQLIMIPTGISLELPSNDYVGLLCARSGLAVKNGITLSNGVGVIDSDYRGEIRVGLCNISDIPYVIEPGERIAQLLIIPVCMPRITLSTDLSDSVRNRNGFGSSGRF